jgi:hypothetical protein
MAPEANKMTSTTCTKSHAAQIWVPDPWPDGEKGWLGVHHAAPIVVQVALAEACTPLYYVWFDVDSPISVRAF